MTVERFTLKTMDGSVSHPNADPDYLTIVFHVHEHGKFTGIEDWIEVVTPATNDYRELENFARAQVKALETEMQAQNFSNDEVLEAWLIQQRKASIQSVRTLPV